MSEKQEVSAGQKAAMWDDPNWEPGRRVSFHDDVRDRGFDGTVIAVNWDRLAGPLVVQVDETGEFLMMLPWDLTVIPNPESLEEIQRYLGLLD